eukprot:5247970-Prymnesium_polylepis.1
MSLLDVESMVVEAHHISSVTERSELLFGEKAAHHLAHDLALHERLHRTQAPPAIAPCWEGLQCRVRQPLDVGGQLVRSGRDQWHAGAVITQPEVAESSHIL